MEKLIRDKIPSLARKEGKPFGARLGRVKSKSAERRRLLKLKLAEEAKEFAERGSLAEMADVMEVVENIKRLYGWTEADIRRARAAKTAKKGAFTKGYYFKW